MVSEQESIMGKWVFHDSRCSVRKLIDHIFNRKVDLERGREMEVGQVYKRQACPNWYGSSIKAVFPVGSIICTKPNSICGVSVQTL